MAVFKITDLASLGANAAANDLQEITDVSDTTMDATGTSKQISIADQYASVRKLFRNASTARVINGAGSSDTYLAGSNIAIPSGYPIVGSGYRCVFDTAKTAAGSAALAVTLRIGTAGSTADAAICTFTFAAGTAAADKGIATIEARFRTVGSGTSAVLVGVCSLVTNLTTTGLANASKALSVVSSGFNSTTANLIVGVSYNGGASAVHTIEQVAAELIL